MSEQQRRSPTRLGALHGAAWSTVAVVTPAILVAASAVLSDLITRNPVHVGDWKDGVAFVAVLAALAAPIGTIAGAFIGRFRLVRFTPLVMAALMVAGFAAVAWLFAQDIRDMPGLAVVMALIGAVVGALMRLSLRRAIAHRDAAELVVHELHEQPEHIPEHRH